MIAPPQIIPTILPDGRTIHVVADHLIAGGTKRRILPSLLADLPEEEFVFGGAAQGYAQVALAYSCQDANKTATYFVAKRSVLHPLTAEAKAAGANIVEIPAGRLTVVQHRAKTYASARGAHFFPLGFDTETFRAALIAEIQKIPISPTEAWCVAGSGALARCMAQAWPTAAIHAVRIGFAPLLNHPNITPHIAPEGFADPAGSPPPFPSCTNYDAKAWQFIIAHAADGALFWNVGR